MASLGSIDPPLSIPHWFSAATEVQKAFQS
jgi:hypothetical protein